MTKRTEQRIAALERANATRRDRAELKAQIARGEVTVVGLLNDPSPAALDCPLAVLLRSQRVWGERRTRKFLARAAIGETKTIRELTARQRAVIADHLTEHQP